jgi:hypothetical protein
VEAAKYAFHELKLLAKIYQEPGRSSTAYKGPTFIDAGSNRVARAEYSRLEKMRHEQDRYLRQHSP